MQPGTEADEAVGVPEPEAEPCEQGLAMLAVPFSLIPSQAVWWLWKGLIPFRHVTLFVAPGKTGKGTSLADLAARLTKGKPMPGDTEQREPMNVIIIAPEDDANEALAPRLEAAGADMARVFNLTKLYDSASGEFVQFYVPENVPDLRVAVEQVEKQTGVRVGMVIIDPVLAIVQKSINGNAAARAVINPLEEFAKQPLDFDPLDPDDDDKVHPGVAVVLTQHTTKAGKTASSQGLVDASRMVLRVERLFPKVNEHPGRRVFVEATNLTDAMRSERFTVHTVVVGDSIESSAVTWQADAKPEGKGGGKPGYKVKGSWQPKQPKPQVKDSPGSKQPGVPGTDPFRLIRRVTTDLALSPTLEPMGYFPSMALAMAEAEKHAGVKLGWQQRNAKPGYTVWAARWEPEAGGPVTVVSFVAWDKREQAKAQQAAGVTA
jgi:AAA domain